ncbi:MAG: phosphate ABC transporter permease subunit PstC [Myxococcota bacterium]
MNAQVLETPRSWPERLTRGGLAICGLVSVLTAAAILAVLAVESTSFFQHVPLSRFLTEREWTPLFADQHFGIWPLVAGTALTTACAMAVALPLGLLAAIQLAEFSSWRTRRVVKPILEMLAAVPTVALGYFALIVVTPALQEVIPGLSSFNALSAGLMMGIMILPLVASLVDDAIRAVPTALREGAYGLGATRTAAIFRVVLPTAASGIAAACLLAVSRAVGETMIVAIAAGQQPQLTADPRQPVETMTSYIVKVSMGDTPAGTLEFQTIFAVGLALFLMTLVLNMLAHHLRGRILKGGRL